MKTKLLLLLGIIPLIALAARTLPLTWLDPENPVGSVDAYCIYERVGTNFVKIGTTTNLVFQLPYSAGVHTFVVTASNKWGESEFSTPASFYGMYPPRNIYVR